MSGDVHKRSDPSVIDVPRFSAEVEKENDNYCLPLVAIAHPRYAVDYGKDLANKAGRNLVSVNKGSPICNLSLHY